MHAEISHTRFARAIVALLCGGLGAAAMAAAPGEAATPLPVSGTTEVVSVGADHVTVGGLFPQVSATGQYVLYRSGRAADLEVILRDRSAGTDTVVFAADADTYGGNLDLAAGGRYAFYYTDEVAADQTSGGRPRIHRYNVAAGSRSLVPLPDAVKAADSWQLLSMSSSANGRYVVTTYSISPDDDVAELGMGTYVTDLGTRQTTDLGIGLGAQATGPRSTSATDISGDGRVVAFSSTESYSPQDGNGYSDSYVVDWRTGAKTLVSRRPDGRATNDNAYGGVLTDNGRYVTFESNANNGVPGLSVNHLPRVFQLDLQTGTTVAVTGGDTYGRLCGASSTGRFVAFTSSAENFGFPTNPGAIANRAQVYRYDRSQDGLHLVSHARRQAWGSKEPVQEGGGGCTIAGNGQLVAFTSGARDLVIDPELVDGYLTDDVFVWTS